MPAAQAVTFPTYVDSFTDGQDKLSAFTKNLAGFFYAIAKPKNQTISLGEAASSDTIRDYEEIIADISNKVTLWHEHQSAFESLTELYGECVLENWDGYGANPITLETYSEATRLLSMISSFVPMPDIVPEPDGGIGLEWYREPNFSFVISVTGENVITYAGLFGTSNETHGKECFGEQLPRIIHSHLSRLYPSIDERS